MTTEERIKLRDELYNEYKKLNFKTFIIKKFKEIINNNLELKNKYDKYVSEFRSEDEALYCINSHDDLLNHLCPICNNICLFYNNKHGYRNTCGNKDCIKARNCSKEAREKAKQTCLNKYGKENYAQTDEFKKQYEEISLKRYGVRHPGQSNIIKNKRYNTMEKRYGVKHALQNKEIKCKCENTCVKNNGVKNPFNSKKIKEKIKITNLEKYGVENPMQSNEIKNKSIHNRIEKNRFYSQFTDEENINILNKINLFYNKIIDIIDIFINDEYFIKLIKLMYNEKNRLLRLQDISQILNFSEQAINNHINKLNLQKYFYIKDSKLELQFKEFLENNNIKFEYRNRNILSKTENNGHSELDFYLKDYNIAFEINDIMSHNSKKKNQFYHINKTFQCRERNIRLIHLWEWELMDEDLWRRTSNWILNLLNNQKVNIDIKDCIIKEIDKETTKNFINEYNLYDYIKSDVNLALFHNDQPLQVITFKRQNNNEYRLLQFCTKFNYVINFGAKELINHFIQSYNPSQITTTINLDKFNSATFEKIGFKLIEYKEPELISSDNNSNSLYKSMYNCGQNIYILGQ